MDDLSEKLIHSKLDQIVENQEAFRTTITAIDASIQGDPKRGVVGITQHIATIQDKVEEHDKSDKAEFSALNDRVSTLSNNLGFKTKYVLGWIAGSGLIIGVVIAIIQLILAM
jgi:hypothetical protein